MRTLVSSYPRATQQLSVDGYDDRARGHEYRADRRRQNEAVPGQQACREWNRHDVVARRPAEVLDHLAVRCGRQRADLWDVAWVAADEHDVSGFNGDIGSGADRDAHVSRNKSWRVVHAITDHRHVLSATLELLDLARLLLGEHLGKDGIDSKFAGDRIRDRPGIPGHHQHFNAAVVESAYRFFRFRTYHVRHREHRKQCPFVSEVNRSLAPMRSPIRRLPQGRR